MKYMIIFFLFMSISMVCMEVPHQNIQEIELTCCEIIDEIFKQARISLEERKDILNPDWIKAQKIAEFQCCMSDALILSFDENSKDEIPERLTRYLPSKIHQEAGQLFKNNKISSDGARQFFYLSEMLCGLSKIPNCHTVVQAIKEKEENETSLLKLKIQEQVQQHERKKDMRGLCEKIVMGALPRR